MNNDQRLHQMAQQIAANRPPIQVAQVPFTAAMDRGQQRVMIDRHVPPFLRVDGKLVDTRATLPVHEMVELEEMDRGDDYDRAHEKATRAEHSILPPGVNERDYETALHPYMKAAKTDYDPRAVPDDINPSQDPEERSLIEDAIKRHALRRLNAPRL